MTDEQGPKIRVRGLVGRNLQRQLDESGISQDQFAARARAHGRDWDQSTVSRFIKGGRALTLEDALSFLALLNVPLVELLRGDELVVLAGTAIPADELRDLVSTGRSSSTAPLAAATDDSGPAAERISSTLGVIVEAVQDSAVRLWGLPVDDELAHRMADSEKRFTGIDPRDYVARIASPFVSASVDPRRRRAWQGHHERAITNDIRDELGTIKTKRGRKQ